VVHITTYKSVGYDVFVRTCSAVRAFACARIYSGPTNYHGGGRSFESPRPSDSFKNT
jgi:hypothetical protein